MKIALCGSTRFEQQFNYWNHKLACAGHTVYSLSLFGREVSDVGKEGNKFVTEDEKITLDLVHLDKILNSDAIVVINQDGYVGFSTAREIRWAEFQRKPVFWHFQDHPDKLYAGDLLIPVREHRSPAATASPSRSPGQEVQVNGQGSAGVSGSRPL